MHSLLTVFLNAAVVVFLTTVFGRYPKVKVAQMSTLDFPTTDKFYLHESAACHALLSGDLVPMLDGYAALVLLQRR